MSHLTLTISTVPLDVVTSKMLLALHKTDVSNVAGIRFAYTAKHTVVFFQDPDTSKSILPLSTLPAINDTLRAYCPMSGTGSFSLVEI